MTLLIYGCHPLAIGRKEKQKSFLSYALQVFRNGLLINNQLDRLVRTAEEERDFNRKFSAFVNHKNAIMMVKLMEDGIQHIERNAHGGLLFADISFKMVKLLKLKA